MQAGIRVTHARVQGCAALTVTNDLLALTVVPELGGKISSIRDLRTGREWLWTNPSLPYRRVAYRASYVREADTGGWDECVPTVAACAYPRDPWRGVQIPDHGEVWSRAWPVEVVSGVASAVTLRAEMRGIALPYVFRRSIAIDAQAAIVRFDYRIDNASDRPLAFIWSAHPLFAIEPGIRVSLPEGTPMHAWLSVPPRLFRDDDALTWPVSVKTERVDVDLRWVPAASARLACKLWSNPLSEGEVALMAPDGIFRFIFDPQKLPQVGLWLNAGGWSGTGGTPYYNLALEPCIGAQDSLADAVERWGQHGLLVPGGVREWWLEVHLDVR